MSKLQLLVLIALLASASFLATSGLVNSVGVERELPPEPVIEDPADKSAGRARPEPRSLVSSVSDRLASKNLFVPERGPKIDETTGETPPPPPGSATLELTGIGKIGKRQAAIIMVSPGRRSPRSRGAPQPSEAPKKKIFTVGDEIGDTGKTLTEINFDRQEGICEVVLTEPGGGTEVLCMETDDKASQARSATAAKNQQAAAHVRVAPPARDAKSPPPPPGSGGTGVAIAPTTPNITTTPGTGVATPEKPVAEMTREERLKWAIEMRTRHMQNRQKEKETPRP